MEIMKIIKLNENIGIENIMDFYFQFEDAIKSESEIVLDFADIKALEFSVLKLVLLYSMKNRKYGSILKIRNISETVRFQLVMCGLSARNDEIVI